MTFKIHHANSFDWLSSAAPNSFHGVLTDPPFGIVEFTPEEITKLRSGNKGGVWRIPPKIGGSERAPLPRFTTLSASEREHVRTYFRCFGEILYPTLVPGAHVFVAGTPMLQYLVQDGMAQAGFTVRGAVMRLYRGFRGGDRPKLAEKEFPEVCVTPRGNYEPWMLFRKPISEKTVAENLRRWGTGALRRMSVDTPLPDIIQSGKTPAEEMRIGDHPTMKPQHFLRILSRTLLPTGFGVILDPFAGSGSTIAACEAIGYESIGVESDDCHFNKMHKNITKLSSLYPDFKGHSKELTLC
ncbi:DNA methyltransferase [Gluconobacter cerinus]|uniref:DNA methyltransferase n=1 Tax=Gluconobacter cerinus TaxID=38307 RepID=UPI001B8CA38C|nr:DNA methyltransferase [Gluconobacter cerinus]MBS1070080.1 site-specific DNA-methyltransferase [Gluconobacter cerinus]